MDAVLNSFHYALNYLREQVRDISEQQFFAGTDLVNNPPAWVVGHLTYSCQAVGEELGLEPWLAEAWASTFGSGTIQPTNLQAYGKAQLLDALADAETRLTEWIKQLPAGTIDKPLPDENFRKELPTLRHAVTQILVGHPAYHIGQLNLWRKSKGMPKIERPFL